MLNQAIPDKFSVKTTGNKMAFFICYAAIISKVVLLFILAINTLFVVDEFWHFSQSSYLWNGIFDTIWPAKAVGYALFYNISHLLGWDANSMLIIGRIQTALTACMQLWIVYLISRTLGQTRLQALIVIVVVLSFSTYMERTFRLRSETLAILFSMGALLVILRISTDKAWRFLVAGVLCGLAFVTTQKSVYFNFALGIAIVVDALLNRQFYQAARRIVLLGIGVITVILLYALAFGGANFLQVLQALFFGPLEVAMSGQKHYSNLPQFRIQTLLRNAPLYFMCFSGLAVALSLINKISRARRIHLIFTVVITVLVFTHNQPWPYVFTMAIPFLAPLIIVPYQEGYLKPLAQKITLALFVVAVLNSYKRNIQYLTLDNYNQLAVVKTAEGLLSPKDTYFDGIGMLSSRQMSTRMWLDARGIKRARLQMDDPGLMQLISQTPPDVIVLTYRTNALPDIMDPLLTNSYVKVAGNIAVPGRQLNANVPATFFVLTPQSYTLYTKNGALAKIEVLIDGKPQNPPFNLSAGSHDLVIKDDNQTFYLVPSKIPASLVKFDQKQISLFGGIYDF